MCPTKTLTKKASVAPDYDAQLAGFIRGLPSQTLQSLRTVSRRGVGVDVCEALNLHGQSLVELRVIFEQDAIPALALLNQCTNIQSLHLELYSQQSLEETHKDVQAKFIDWLASCHALHTVSLTGFKSAPNILIPLLLNPKLRLQDLSLGGSTAGDRTHLYSMVQNRDFHLALATQSSLEGLSLAGDGEGSGLDDIEALVSSLGELKQLRKLQLFGVSEFFSDKDVISIFTSLQNLEEVYIGGYGISDSALLAASRLGDLKMITFAGVTSFSADGLRQFLGALGPGNEGISISVEMADPDRLIPDPIITAIREEFSSSLGGKLEYTPLRGNR